MEPLIHIYDKESQFNKRVVQITSPCYNYPIYMEWISGDMITLQTFKKEYGKKAHFSLVTEPKTI